MAKRKPLTHRIFINGEERLPTEEESDRMVKRMGEALCEYFEQHPDQYKDWCRRYDEREAREKAEREAQERALSGECETPA